MSQNCSSENGCCGNLGRLAAWVVGVAGSFAIIGLLAVYTVKKTDTTALDAERARLRQQARREIDASVSVELTRYAIDPAKANKAKLGIDRAIELFISEWKDDSAAGRAKLLQRLEDSKKEQSFE